MDMELTSGIGNYDHARNKDIRNRYSNSDDLILSTTLTITH